MKTVNFASTVNPNGYETTVIFYVGTTIDNLAVIGDPIVLSAGQTTEPVQLQIDLGAETNYVTKATAENQEGLVETGITEFRTPDENGLPIITDVVVTFP